MDDLVKRLRNSAQWHHSDCALKMECADRIEADAARIAELALDALVAHTQADEAYQTQLAAEARVKVLEDALTKIGILSPVKKLSDIARAALEGEET